MADKKITKNLIVINGIKVSDDESVHLGYGVYTISILSIIFGETLALPLLEIRRFSVMYFIILTYTLVINVMLSVFAISSSLCFFNYISDLPSAVYIIPAFLTLIEFNVRIYLMMLKKRKIDKLIKSIKFLLTYSYFKSHQRAITTRVSHYVTVILLVLLSGILMSFSSNYFSVRKDLNIIHDNNVTLGKCVLLNASVEVTEMWLYMEGIYKFMPSTGFLIYVFLTYFFFVIGCCKLVVTDVFFSACYWLVIEELGLLSSQLDEVIQKSKSSHLASWLDLHHHVTRLLEDVNDVASPAILVAVVVSALQMSLFAFIIVKQNLVPSNTLSVLLLALICSSQLIVYCILGHRIRWKISRLEVSAYRSNWLRSRRGKQHAALMICSAANERGMELPGAPFFALSLEFLASITGAIFTYFIVLLQVVKES